MGGADFVTQAWKEGGLQALVLLSFTLQVALLVLAEFRRHMDSGVLRFFVCSAYMMADATAIYVLGHLSVTSRSPRHELLALWAPFLLLHLGGQDKITAYAIEDNQLWLRHLQTFTVQVAAAAYVIYGSIVVNGDGRRPFLLPVVAILMFVVGVVEYGERVWAVRCAGTSPTGNYQSDIGIRRISLGVPDSFMSRLDPTETFLLNAHLLLDFAKDRCLRGHYLVCSCVAPVVQDHSCMGRRSCTMWPRCSSRSCTTSYSPRLRLHTYTWYGLCIRVLSSLATAAAFLLFNILLLGDHRRKLKGYNRLDVVVTYVLFVEAVVLENLSLLRAMFSSWTCALLVKYGSEGSTACNLLAHVPMYLRRLVHAAEWRRKCSWSRSMGQLNLIQLFVRSRASRCRKMARWMGLEDWWNTLAYSGPSVPISACIKQLLLKSLKARQWGREEFESRGLYGDRAWVADSKLEERILIWHIATEIYLCWYKKDQEQAEAAAGGADLAGVAQVLSNYMLFLLASRPHMLSPDASRNDYLVLCYALTCHLQYNTAEDLLALLQRYAEALRANNSAPEFGLTSKNTNRLGDKALRGGCSLGAFLIHRQDNSPGGVAGTLEMICEVWAQMLCCVGDECSANSHAKQLSSGGELLTVVALVAKYMRSIRLSAYFHIDSCERAREW